jgi:hypothetical protein
LPSWFDDEQTEGGAAQLERMQQLIRKLDRILDEMAPGYPRQHAALPTVSSLDGNLQTDPGATTPPGKPIELSS